MLIWHWSSINTATELADREWSLQVRMFLERCGTGRNVTCNE